MNIENVGRKHELFIFYGVDDLQKYLLNKEEYLHKSILLLLDNASYHKSSRAVACLQSAFKIVVFISPYSPQFNQIELFFRALKLKVGNG